MPRTLLAVVAAVVSLLAAGCKKGGDAPQAPVAAAIPAAPVAAAAGPAQKLVVKGPIVEKLDTGSQSLLRLSTEKGDAWVMIPTTNRLVGEQVEVDDPVALPGYQSKELGRTFPVVYFGNAL
jgi:hypothetical protein